jgi:anti-sigma factor RsiW
MNPETEQLSCQELVELVTAYLEDALSPEDVARFEAHVDACVGCRRHLDQMRATLVVLGRLPAEPLSVEAEQALLAAFRGWKAS